MHYGWLACLPCGLFSPRKPSDPHLTRNKQHLRAQLQSTFLLFPYFHLIFPSFSRYFQPTLSFSSNHFFTRNAIDVFRYGTDRDSETIYWIFTFSTFSNGNENPRVIFSRIKWKNKLPWFFFHRPPFLVALSSLFMYFFYINGVTCNILQKMSQRDGSLLQDRCSTPSNMDNHRIALCTRVYNDKWKTKCIWLSSIERTCLFVPISMNFFM